MVDLDWGTLGTVVLVLVGITVLIALALVVRLVMKHRQVHRPGVPVSAKVSYYGSLLYAVVPVDLLPDPIVLDDITVLLGGLLYVGRAVRKAKRREEPPLTRSG